jgi:hypothetical protein
MCLNGMKRLVGPCEVEVRGGVIVKRLSGCSDWGINPIAESKQHSEGP